MIFFVIVASFLTGSDVLSGSSGLAGSFLGLPLGFGCGSSLGISASGLAFLFGSGLPFGGVLACLFSVFNYI
jgi:hypothetical protein